MYDDIVSRLRYHASNILEYSNDVETHCLLHDAADAINRLKAEANRWLSVSERFAESHPQFDAFHAYFKEVRGG